MNWEQEAEGKFKLLISKLPFFHRHIAEKVVIKKAEELAGLEPLPRASWHAFRRKWATERKHLPDVDVAAAGGWNGTATLNLIYKQPDQATMLRVVLEAGELRETSQGGGR